MANSASPDFVIPFNEDTGRYDERFIHKQLKRGDESVLMEPEFEAEEDVFDFETELHKINGEIVYRTRVTVKDDFMRDGRLMDLAGTSIGVLIHAKSGSNSGSQEREHPPRRILIKLGMVRFHVEVLSPRPEELPIPALDSECIKIVFRVASGADAGSPPLANMPIQITKIAASQPAEGSIPLKSPIQKTTDSDGRVEFEYTPPTLWYAEDLVPVESFQVLVGDPENPIASTSLYLDLEPGIRLRYQVKKTDELEKGVFGIESKEPVVVDLEPRDRVREIQGQLSINATVDDTREYPVANAKVIFELWDGTEWQTASRNAASNNIEEPARAQNSDSGEMTDEQGRFTWPLPTIKYREDSESKSHSLRDGELVEMVLSKEAARLIDDFERNVNRYAPYEHVDNQTDELIWKYRFQYVEHLASVARPDLKLVCSAAHLFKTAVGYSKGFDQLFGDAFDGPKEYMANLISELAGVAFNMVDAGGKLAALTGKIGDGIKIVGEKFLQLPEALQTILLGSIDRFMTLPLIHFRNLKSALEAMLEQMAKRGRDFGPHIHGLYLASLEKLTSLNMQLGEYIFAFEKLKTVGSTAASAASAIMGVLNSMTNFALDCGNALIEFSKICVIVLTGVVGKMFDLTTEFLFDDIMTGSRPETYERLKSLYDVVFRPDSLPDGIVKNQAYANWTVGKYMDFTAVGWMSGMLGTFFSAQDTEVAGYHLILPGYSRHAKNHIGSLSSTLAWTYDDVANLNVPVDYQSRMEAHRSVWSKISAKSRRKEIDKSDLQYESDWWDSMLLFLEMVAVAIAVFIALVPSVLASIASLAPGFAAAMEGALIAENLGVLLTNAEIVLGIFKSPFWLNGLLSELGYSESIAYAFDWSTFELFGK